MVDRDVSAPEVQVALVEGAQKRMTDRVNLWLANSKVKAALNRFNPTEVEHKEAC